MSKKKKKIVSKHTYRVERITYSDGSNSLKRATCIWLKGLPKLVPTNIVEGRDQRIWKMSPGPERAKERSKTFQGIADAMADQWS